jgi:leucyl-tRNA synthetase
VIYSPRDGQPCADHDRAEGEGVAPQDYTLVKMEVLEPLPVALASLSGSHRVYLLAATLRPETMYGQTNCYVLPDGEYGVFAGAAGEAYVMCERAMRNLSYQNEDPAAFGKYDTLIESVLGASLIGARLSAPLSSLPHVYVFPMFTISLDKGTGVVTSVPSDSADDFITIQDIKKKKPLQEKYGITEEMLATLTPVPIIDIPGYGTNAAEKVCAELKGPEPERSRQVEGGEGGPVHQGLLPGRDVCRRVLPAARSPRRRI